MEHSSATALGQQEPGAKSRGSRSAEATALEELIQRKDVARAWDQLEDMQRRGLGATRFAVSRLLMLTVGNEVGCPPASPAQVRRALGLVEEFIDRHPEEADEVLFNAQLDTCHRARDVPRLERTMLRMEELRVKPSHVTLGILVKAYGQAGDATRVINLWDRMAEERSQANAVTCGCMIDACVKCGRLEKALEIFEEMKKSKRHRNTILYTTLIKGCGLKKDLRQALSLFREMKSEKVPYNRITYNSVMDVCVKCLDVPAAENIFAEMTSPGSGIDPDHITYSTLLKGYCHMGDLDKALQVAATIKASKLPCDEMVYNSLMDGCVRASDLSAGIGLFAEMIRSNVHPSAITHGILVRLYSRTSNASDACEAVASLYMHHGLPRPDASLEQRSRRGGNGRRGRRQQKGLAAATETAPLSRPRPAMQVSLATQLQQPAAMAGALPPPLLSAPALTLPMTAPASTLPQPWATCAAQPAPSPFFGEAGAFGLSQHCLGVQPGQEAMLMRPVVGAGVARALGLPQPPAQEAMLMHPVAGTGVAQALGLPQPAMQHHAYLPQCTAALEAMPHMFQQTPASGLPQSFIPPVPSAIAPPPFMGSVHQVLADTSGLPPQTAAAPMPHQAAGATQPPAFPPPPRPGNEQAADKVVPMQTSAVAETLRRAGLRRGAAAWGGM